MEFNHQLNGLIMKKQILVIVAFMTFINLSFTQTPNWIWAKSAYGTTDDFANCITIDVSGNVIIAGTFASPVLSLDSISLANADITGNSLDVFLAKYNANGNVLWAKSADGDDDDEVTSIAFDNSGNIYVTGIFYGNSITFDTITLTNMNSGYGCDYLTKYDTNGNVIWAKNMGSPTNIYIAAVRTDNLGNIYLAGNLKSSTITFDTIVLSNVGGSDLFIAKYNAMGNVIWAKSTVESNTIGVYNFTIDILGNIYLSGGLNGISANFGSTTLTNTNPGTDDVFLVKYDSNANIVWAKSAGGTDLDDVYSIAVDNSGNSFITGYFDSPTMTFDSIIISNIGYGYGTDDIFLAKYDSNGNVLWAKSAGGIDQDGAICVVADTMGNSFIAGDYNSQTINFGSVFLTNSALSTYDMFVAKYDANGNTLWVKTAAGIFDEYDFSLALDAFGYIYCTGWFASPQLTIGSSSLINHGGFDVFLAKLGIGTGINELSNSLGISIFPNPANNNITMLIPIQS